ncbi:MAG TPA: hypothetical protein VF808_01895 [Ktedonobacterales bacterium]
MTRPQRSGEDTAQCGEQLMFTAYTDARAISTFIKLTVTRAGPHRDTKSPVFGVPR